LRRVESFAHGGSPMVLLPLLYQYGSRPQPECPSIRARSSCKRDHFDEHDAVLVIHSIRAVHGEFPRAAGSDIHVEIVMVNTSARGASRTREITISRSDDAVTGLLFCSATFSLLRLQFLQIVVQAAQTLLPMASVTRHPIGNLF
jgi:hypothetical protein